MGSAILDDYTHVKDLEDSGKLLLPTNNRFFVILRVKDPRKHISFALLGDLLLDRGNGSATENLVSALLSVDIPGSPHPVKFPIAARTDELSSSSCRPFNPRSRTWHTSAQDSPRSV